MQSLIETPKLRCHWETADNLSKLPEHKAIYLCCDADDRVLYVGQTLQKGGIRARMKTHHLKPYTDFKKRFRMLYWWQLPLDVNEVEASLIRKYQPEFNHEHAQYSLSLKFDEEVAF